MKFQLAINLERMNDSKDMDDGLAIGLTIRTGFGSVVCRAVKAIVGRMANATVHHKIAPVT